MTKHRADVEPDSIAIVSRQYWYNYFNGVPSGWTWQRRHRNEYDISKDLPPDPNVAFLAVRTDGWDMFCEQIYTRGRNHYHDSLGGCISWANIWKSAVEDNDEEPAFYDVTYRELTFDKAKEEWT